MKYRNDYLYQLAEDEYFQTRIRPDVHIVTDFIELNTEGLLRVKRGYAWDGPSGPTKLIVEYLEKIPFVGKWLAEQFLKAFLTPSLGHDAKYQLLRQGYLSPDNRSIADDELKTDCLKRGMSKTRAGWVHEGVKKFAAFAADPKNKKKTYEVT